MNDELIPPGGTVLADGDKISVGYFTTITVSINTVEEARGVAVRAAANNLAILKLMLR